MAKIETLTTQYMGEIELFASAMMFVSFKKKFGKSLSQAFADDNSDMEALAFALFTCYQSACKILSKEEKYNIDDFLNKLDLEELTKGVTILFPNVEDTKKK